MTLPTSGRIARAPWRLPGASVPVPTGRPRAAGVPPGPGTARIAVDLLGGDTAPAVVVDGALRAFGADPDLHLLLVGPPEAAGPLLGALGPADRRRISLRAVRSSVTMTDVPVRAISPDTTVRAAAAAVAEGAADALVSAGATGATVTAAVLGFGRWPDVRRPALVATLPAVAGPVVLLDVGGSLEARVVTLARHALLGAAYASVVHGVAAPRLGLLSIGTETGKGDRVRRAADPVLAGQSLPGGARYAGLVEGYDVAAGGRADVIITDGFTGNVLLKGIEGAYALAGGPPASGGAPRAAALLGVAGTVVVCHGSAGAADIASGIALAARLHRRDAVARMARLVAELPGTDERRRDARPAADAGLSGAGSSGAGPPDAGRGSKDRDDRNTDTEVTA